MRRGGSATSSSRRRGAGDVAAIAVLDRADPGLARLSEVLDRVIRDLDDDGRLWIPTSKTDAGRRERCAELRRLLELAGAPAGDDRLFRGSPGGAAGGAGRRHERLAALPHRPALHGGGRAAGLPHSLRGLHSTLAVGGATPHLVAASLGHADRGGTARRYLHRAGRARAAVHAAGRRHADRPVGVGN